MGSRDRKHERRTTNKEKRFIMPKERARRLFHFERNHWFATVSSVSDAEDESDATDRDPDYVVHREIDKD